MWNQRSLNDLDGSFTDAVKQWIKDLTHSLLQ